jgi:hypothetical protein
MNYYIKHKYTHYSVSHGFGSEALDPKDWYHLQRHLRIWYFNDDGNQPKNSQTKWRVIMIDYFDNGPRPKRNKAIKKNWIIGHLYRFSEDDIHGARGISQAIKWYTGKYPGKYKKFYQ